MAAPKCSSRSLPHLCRADEVAHKDLYGAQADFELYDGHARVRRRARGRGQRVYHCAAGSVAMLKRTHNINANLLALTIARLSSVGAARDLHVFRDGELLDDFVQLRRRRGEEEEEEEWYHKSFPQTVCQVNSHAFRGCRSPAAPPCRQAAVGNKKRSAKTYVRGQAGR